MPSALLVTPTKPPVRLCWERDGGRGGVGREAEEPFRRVTRGWSKIGRRRKKKKKTAPELLDCENELLQVMGIQMSPEIRLGGGCFRWNMRGWGGVGSRTGGKSARTRLDLCCSKGSLGYPATTARYRQSMLRVIKSQVGPLESCACQLSAHRTFLSS